MNPLPTRALVVDDSASKRYVIGTWLRRGGLTTVEATTGAEALARVDDSHIDVVVLDIRLPDMSGIAVCEQIKQNPAHATIPVIQISAVAVEPADRTYGLAHGADAYLVEPIDPAELLATVNATLRSYRGRQQAERYAARLAVLNRLTLSLNAARTVEELLREAVLGAASIWRGPAVVCADKGDGEWLVASIDGPDREPTVRPTVRPGVLAGGLRPTPGAFADVPADAVGHAVWAPHTTVRVMSASVRVDRPVWVLVPAELTDPDAPVLSLVAQAISVAMESIRAYQVEHQLALTLQRSLLPRRLPKVDGWDLAARYVPASETAEIGGDFYELSCLDGKLVVAVGDVGGHSVHAATVMAELRHATRAYVAEGHSPGQVLDRLNTLMRRLIPDEIATMCLMTIEPETGAVCLANAGHPPPLVVAESGVTFLEDRVPLLGMPSPGALETTVELPTGATMVLYTDGLVERRGVSIDVGTARLVEQTATIEADLNVFCERLLREVGPAEPADDIALVALRRTAAPHSRRS